MRPSLAFVSIALCAALGQYHAGLDDAAALLQASRAVEPMIELFSNHREHAPARIRQTAPWVASRHKAVLKHMESSNSAMKRMQAANESGIPIPFLTMGQIQAAQQAMQHLLHAAQGFDAAVKRMVVQMSQIYPFTRASVVDPDDLDFVDEFNCMNMSTARRANFDEVLPLLQAVFHNYRQGWDNVYASLFESADLITNFFEQAGSCIRDVGDMPLIRNLWSRTRYEEELDVKHHYLNCILENLSSAEFTPRTHLMREFVRDAWNCTMFLNSSVFTESRARLEQGQQMSDELTEGYRLGLRLIFGAEYLNQMDAYRNLANENLQRIQTFGNLQAALLCDKTSRMDRVRRDISRAEAKLGKQQDELVNEE